MKPYEPYRPDAVPLRTPHDYAMLIDDLSYANYKHNRTRSPEIPVEWYKTIFGEAVEAMERRYQAEITGVCCGEPMVFDCDNTGTSDYRAKVCRICGRRI